MRESIERLLALLEKNYQPIVQVSPERAAELNAAVRPLTDIAERLEHEQERTS